MFVKMEMAIYLYILLGVEGYMRSVFTSRLPRHMPYRYMDNNDRGRIIRPNHTSSTYVRRKYLAITRRRNIHIIKNKELNLWRSGM
jgi:hypothetical protein